MNIYREFIYPDCVEFYNENWETLATVNSMWAAMLLTKSFENDGGKVVIGSQKEGIKR